MIFGAVGFAPAFILLSYEATSFVEGSPNIWWLVLPTAVVAYLLVCGFGGVIRGRS